MKKVLCMCLAVLVLALPGKKKDDAIHTDEEMLFI
jgi:hypothetical protein